VGDEEGAAAGTPQRADGGLDPDPIGIRLDHGRAFGRRTPVAQQAPVRRERAEVDGERGARLERLQRRGDLNPP
jgi:hypothetical protein